MKTFTALHNHFIIVTWGNTRQTLLKIFTVVIFSLKNDKNENESKIHLEGITLFKIIKILL